MKLISKLGIILAATSIVACAPRDTVHYYSISDALNSSEAKTALNPKVQLYFGKAAPGKVIVPNAVTNKKTNAANKTDEASCQWAFISAVKQLQERAEKEGATKVLSKDFAVRMPCRQFNERCGIKRSNREITQSRLKSRFCLS